MTIVHDSSIIRKQSTDMELMGEMANIIIIDPDIMMINQTKLHQSGRAYQQGWRLIVL